ncbi:MAG: uracil-DNA glycosylase, partial [Alphaproteobacteria bacterium]|nr:uracil-DNA glycosylase [Alphaproteobacteria bacterium]
MPFKEPDRDCSHCPRLAKFRQQNRATYPDFFNAPVPSFGNTDAVLLIVGLAPGLRGANRTGRPFTGDYAGDLLYRTLPDFGLASGQYAARSDDGYVLDRCRITNSVRCVPPGNKPTPDEIRSCRSFLAAEIAMMPHLKGLLALGQVAHRAVIVTLGHKQKDFLFTHGAIHDIGERRFLADSYHCSRYNTNTGRLSETMFRSVFDKIGARLA